MKNYNLFKKQWILLSFSLISLLTGCVSTDIPKSNEIPIDYKLQGKEIIYNLDYLTSKGITLTSLENYNYFDEIDFNEGKLLVIWTYNTFYVDQSFRQYVVPSSL